MNNFVEFLNYQTRLNISFNKNNIVSVEPYNPNDSLQTTIVKIIDITGNETIIDGNYTNILDLINEQS